MIALADRFADLAEQWAEAQVPYVHRGTRRTGCDCTGLVIGCLQELGYLQGYKLRIYPHDWNLHAAAGDYIQEEIGRVAYKLDERPKRGDILLFRFGRCVAHAGVLVRWPVFVHCHLRAREMAKGLITAPAWGSRWVASWRLDQVKLEAMSHGK